MSDSLWLALGLVLVIEGLTYAVLPRQMQNLMRHIQNAPVEQLRLIGATALAIGVFVIWLVK